ncbi:MAG TPA: hypothetical protein VHN14_11580 [Kofleriaceae bacterium]|jgi:hypothetical protein|nr:hypothetical protein [Kofleriaceae bacterium]
MDIDDIDIVGIKDTPNRGITVRDAEEGRAPGARWGSRGFARAAAVRQHQGRWLAGLAGMEGDTW